MTAYQHMSPFESFSLDRALALAMASEMAYRPAEEIYREATREWGFNQFYFFNVGDTQAYLAADAEAMIVAFRGTEAGAIADWLTDVDMDLVDGPFHARVHKGFYEALADIWQPLQYEIGRLDPRRTKRLWVTGHSLGGALATLAAACWTQRGRPVHGVYTFGQPRAGDAKFARAFNFELKSSAFRFVNNCDVVTRVPPRALGYSHVGLCKYFADNGRLEEHISWWGMFLDRWTFRWEDFWDMAPEGAVDHSMIAYRQLIENALPRAISSGIGGAARRTVDAVQHAVGQSHRLIHPRRRAA